MYRKILTDLGKTPAEIETLFANFPSSASRAVATRGRIDGQPVNVYVNPTSVPDPQIHTVVGKYAYGFNLDGKGAASPNSFEDPDTHEQGVDNQVFRAMGCYNLERGGPNERPTYPTVQWDMTRDQMPAWVIEITAANGFDKDGDVTVGLYRAIEPITRSASGDPQSDMAFRIDPIARSQNVLHGKLKNGMIVTDSADVNMTGDPFAMAEYHFKNTHIRLALKPDGTLKGILGGYQPWRHIYTSYALGGAPPTRANLSIDTLGIYYALRRLADAYPDPKTGQNEWISTAYVIEAIPAFAVHPSDNKFLADDARVSRIKEAR